ncbi:MAG TPA: hypothetical protein VG326_08975 [Tepidisphaeraceae bacterium]|jgi:hypothetical protein|nr:hypothetical protein [Tepidisphaeraceae bacterium]
MLRRVLFPSSLVWLLACAVGCVPTTLPRTADEQAMFGVATFRIHPTFTQIKNWTGGKKPDGIEAIIEFDDQFGEPTRAAGMIRLELYNFRSADPDHRGQRLAIWSATLSTHDDQVGHWDPAARGYTFQLAFPKINADHAYVLTAQFDHNNTRLFDQLVLEPSAKEGYHGDRRIKHAPADAPGRGY